MDNNEKIEGDALNPQEQEQELEESANGTEQEEVSEDNVDSEETEDSSDTEGVDYESEVEKLKQKFGKKLDKTRDKIRQLKENTVPKEEVDKIVDEKLVAIRKEIQEERAQAIAERMSKSPDEAELILLNFKHRIVPSGNLQEDMEAAYALANSKKFEGKMSELKTALKSKKSIPSGGSGAGAPVEQKPKVKYSQEIVDAAKFAGKTPEEFAKELGKK